MKPVAEISLHMSLYSLAKKIIFSLLILCIHNSPSNAQWENVIENKKLSQTLRIVGPQYNNTLIKNIIIENVKGDGIYIKDVKNIRIENITVKNIKNGSGIRLGISGSTSDVEIIGNTLQNIDKNGINAGQRHKKNIDHKNLKILQNTITKACKKGSKGLHHAIYVQTQDFYIANNTIDGCKDGNGISIRSSGIVEHNTINKTGKSGIAYFDDHMKGKSDTVIIRDNIITNAGRNAIDILPMTHPKLTVKNFIIQENVTSNEKIGIENKKVSNERNYTINNFKK